MRTPEREQEPPKAQALGPLPQPYALGTRHAGDLSDNVELDDLEMSLRNRGYVRPPHQHEKKRRYPSE